MTINITLPEQSSAGDWNITQQLVADADGQPVWSSVPADLVVTMTVIPEGVSLRQDYGSFDSLTQAAVITAKSNDATGRLTAFVNGVVQVHITAADMAALAPDRYGIYKRYLVFFKIEVGGETRQFTVGVLPVFLGA